MKNNAAPTHNATSRFSDRVADYVKFRPHYPLEILDLLAANCGLTPDSVVADIGSGTGILTQLFLDNGNAVVGIEPNQEMRVAGEEFLEDYGRFTSMEGTAETTGLPAKTFNFVLAGQAFHWFDRTKTRAEFKRILQDDGWVVLIWNDRRVDSTPFLRDYEALLQQHATDYNQINHKNVQDPAVFAPFFGGPFSEAAFDNVQSFDFDGLMGRLHSSSYIPPKDHAGYAAMAQHTRKLFDTHQINGRIEFVYDTRVYYGGIA